MRGKNAVTIGLGERLSGEAGCYRAHGSRWVHLPRQRTDELDMAWQWRRSEDGTAHVLRSGLGIIKQKFFK